MHCEAWCFYTDLGFGVLYIQTDMSQSTTHILHVAFFFCKFYNHGGYEHQEAGIVNSYMSFMT